MWKSIIEWSFLNWCCSATERSTAVIITSELTFIHLAILWIRTQLWQEFESLWEVRIRILISLLQEVVCSKVIMNLQGKYYMIQAIITEIKAVTNIFQSSEGYNLWLVYLKDLFKIKSVATLSRNLTMGTEINIVRRYQFTDTIFKKQFHIHLALKLLISNRLASIPGMTHCGCLVCVNCEGSHHWSSNLELKCSLCTYNAITHFSKHSYFEHELKK